MLAFTFDDGPDPECTPAILDLLRERRARATFFVLGDATERAPALVQRAVSEGHELGVHGYDHRAMTDLPVRARIASVVRGRGAVTRAVGQRARWFRAPYGKQTVAVAAVARGLGMRSVMWDAYAREWEDHPIEWCAEHAAAAMIPGSIVLLHDGAGGQSGRTRPSDEVVILVRSLLAVAEDRGLAVVPVGELLRHGRPRRRLWFRHWKV